MWDQHDSFDIFGHANYHILYKINFCYHFLYGVIACTDGNESVYCYYRMDEKQGKINT